MNTDKNTIIGFVLMALVVFAFMMYDSHRMKENAIAQQENAIVEAAEQEQKEAQEAKAAKEKADKLLEQQTDTLNPLFQASTKNEGTTVIENELLRLTINNKGGQLCKAELKDSTYKTWDKTAQVVLFDNDDSNLKFLFNGKEHNIITDELYFTPTSQDNGSVTMRLPIAGGSIDFAYSLVPESYLLHLDIQANGLEGFFPAKTDKVDIVWNEKMRQQEKGFSFENQHSTIEYREDDHDTEVLSSGGTDKEETEFEKGVYWLAFKDQFFSQVLIADEAFKVEKLSSKQAERESGYIKTYDAEFSANFDPTGKNPTNLNFYLGPNRFNTLKENEAILYKNNSAGITKDRDLDLQSLVYLGWPLIRYINRFFFVYLFDWMTRLGLNMGIVLLLLTIVIKFLVYPLMKKSYLSSANMRVLKPKVDEISKKYPKKEDAMQKNQEVMQLYSKYGVSPMGGCLPMLIQMPIWIALFNFIPNAIELRGQSFLWASDLSTYDDVIRWGKHIWGIGDHLSLFCVLWCLSTVANTWISMRQQSYSMTEEQQQQMGMMKWMSYLMPIVFFFSFNGYSSGLNYYYFVSGIISILMMWYLRKTTDDAKLLQKLEERYKRRQADPSKPGGMSGMARRLQELAELQQKKLEEQQRKNNRQ
ncbi:MAG: membrane protein insertase YidC [Bacteroidaceae bacterium]|jgi:YidC/Oxa1 family membrane protein insertase|nr:membrane protein insertase YidC [Bacteroidaceae bacterium]